MFAGLPPLSLYVHIPWCEKKCPYCDFNSHQSRDSLPEREYIHALLDDLDQELPGVWGRKLHSVFIGGGTPSLLRADCIDTLLSGIRARMNCIPDIEVTLEANPGSAESAKFKDLKQAGVNRLSIGVQSFDDELLRAIGRVHDAEAARAAVGAAVDAGFDNFNLDLMYALPGQDVDIAARDLHTALAFDPPHVSYYQLTIEPNTRFYKHPPTLPDEDAAWRMQSNGETLLADHGLEQYEVSAYAQADRSCRHNLNYWRFGDYIGIGAGAHAKITTADGVARSWKVKQPADFLRKAGSHHCIGSRRELSAAEIRFEFMLNALRLTAPVSSLHFQQYTGQPIATIKPLLEQARHDGLLDFDGIHMTATALGRRFLNDLLQRFLPPTQDNARNTGES